MAACSADSVLAQRLKVFARFADQAELPTGWFYCLKTRVMVNVHRQLVPFDVTTGSPLD